MSEWRTVTGVLRREPLVYLDASVVMRPTSYFRGQIDEAAWHIRKGWRSAWLERLFGNEWGMAGSFANFFAKKVLDHNFGATTYAALATHYMLLSTTTIADDGTGATEPAGNGYARASFANNTTNYTNATGTTIGTKTTGTAWTFAEATGAQGTITYAAIMDALSAGNMLVWGSLTASIAPVANTAARFPAGNVTITLD